MAKHKKKSLNKHLRKKRKRDAIATVVKVEETGDGIKITAELTPEGAEYIKGVNK